ncbi:MAG: hypothetical protein H6970_12345 [Gammaproteobacteria bacterium]|nr:hypothetical protein [Gammaproteobacteria bacterium]MCP5425838.1 hypothetical protein [Gammaproteobacteria bacterium]MCP5458552.1 hypothetical protein [Gammaproteobacteria bacterium]
MKRLDIDIDTLRILLTMRRRVHREFSVFVSLEDDRACEIICDYGYKSTDNVLRKMAKEVSQTLAKVAQQEIEVTAATEETRFYRGMPVSKETSDGSEEVSHPSKTGTVETPQFYRGVLVHKEVSEPADGGHLAQSESDTQEPTNDGHKPSRKRFYRGQLIEN